MTGYENLLVVVYHSGPSIYGCQALRMKVINTSTRNFKTISDTECPLSRQSVLVWLGFSDEGALLSFDSEGVMRAFNFGNEQWSPMMDFKVRHYDVYAQLWIVGVTEDEVLAIEMARDHQSPLLAQKNQIRRYKLKMPLLKQEGQVDSKDLTQSQIEGQVMAQQFWVEHETFRKE